MAPNLIGYQQPPLKKYVPPSELMTKVLALLDGAKENWVVPCRSNSYFPCALLKLPFAANSPFINTSMFLPEVLTWSSKAEFDISSASSYKIEFKAVSGSSYMSDAAVDEIILNDVPCSK